MFDFVHLQNDVFVISLFCLLFFVFVFYFFLFFFIFFLFLFLFLFRCFVCDERVRAQSRQTSCMCLRSQNRFQAPDRSCSLAPKKRFRGNRRRCAAKRFQNFFCLEKLFLFSLFCFVLFEKKKKKLRNVFVVDFEIQRTNSCSHVLRQFGLKSFGPLISNWRRFRRI